MQGWIIPSSRRILHIDMDAFFAGVELLRYPDLKGRPVIVGGRGDPSKRGLVSTSSYEARKFGVHSGMALRTAYRLCPKAVFLPVDFPLYARISKRIKAILRMFSPVMEDVGIDEAFLDITSLTDPPEKIALAIKERILSETGLTCSIGIAPNKLLAKMASDMEKPDGLTILTEDDAADRIWPLPVRKLWGVELKTEERLSQMGVSTIGELAALSLGALIARFGQAHGRYLHTAARGIDHSSLIAHWEPKSVSRETTFQKDIQDRQILARVLTRLVREVAIHLREQDCRGKTVAVKLRYADFETHTHAATLGRPTEDLRTLLWAALHCLRHFPLVKKVRLVGVRISGLVKGSASHEP
jgi:DNA polymerase-4